LNAFRRYPEKLTARSDSMVIKCIMQLFLNEIGVFNSGGVETFEWKRNARAV